MSAILSKRMQAVADMAVPGYRIADIGCDHGFISIHLIREGIAPFVYAADVRPGPLSRAKEHIEAAGLSAYIMPVLSDGLKEIPEDPAAEAIIAAGIGGKLTIKILSDCPEKTKKLSWMVLEPQSEIWLVRQWLSENGFYIIKEDLVYEDGKFYPVLLAVNQADGRWQEQLRECSQRQAEAAGGWEALSGKDSRFTKERWKAACDMFGLWPILSVHCVLKEYLTHILEKDKALLTDLKKAQEKSGAERIGEQLGKIAERMLLCELILYFMKTL